MSFNYLCKLFGFLFLAMSLISFSGCTTRLKKAQNMLVEKNYEEALKIFDEILIKDAKNEDAQLGLRKAREGVIDQNLIKVRLLRMGSNVGESFEMLKSVFDKQNSWQVFPTGAVAFTQKEETGMAFVNLKRELRANLDQQRALKVSYMIQRYSFMFDENQKKDIQTYQAEAVTQGNKICKEERKTQNQNSPFWSVFVDKICSYYKVARSSKDKPQKWNRQLYRHLEAQFADHKIEAEKPEKTLEAAVRSFQSTAWYDSESSGVLKQALNAQFSFQHQRTPRLLTHYYTVKEPYTTYETKQVMNSSTGQLQQETVPVTAYRDSERNLQYQATEHNLRTEMNVSSSIQGSEFQLQFPFSKNENGGGVESFTENREINLIKQTPQNIFPSSYFYEKFLKDFSEESKKKLIEKYVELFCTPIATESNRTAKANMALKCLRQTKASPYAAASQWTRDTYALEVSQLDELLSL